MLRTIRRWNQTGQKYAGEPDIARTFLAEHNIVLWTLVGITYAWVATCLVKDGFPGVPRSNVIPSVLALMFFAVSFKVAFTVEDAPELLKGIDSASFLAVTQRFDLVTKARFVFLCVGLLAVLVIAVLIVSPSLTRKSHKGTLWPHAVMIC